ncbi:MAG: hybrid sensor histidine kinase/response regulator [Desulfobulbaceae bacterium]|nr:hybrid sensor histidine kinase/response regulator [Desulfobulbaceae bacterium]
MGDDKGIILVVDDNDSTRLLVEDTLEEEGYQIYTAENGQDGLAMAHQYHPDVIVLDVMMPGLNGYEVCRKIRNDRHLADTRVIMLTARAFADDRLRGLQDAGADDYLTKPFSNDELVARIEKLWRRKKEKEVLEKTISRAEHDAEIGILAAGVAHDFNNILAGLMTHVVLKAAMESIWNGLNDEQQKSMARDFDDIRMICDGMQVSVTTGETICRNLMSFARGGVDNSRRRQPFNTLFEVPLGIFERKIRSNGIELVMDIADEPILVDCNFSGMQRVALNLITNAVHAMNESEIRKLTLRLWREGSEAKFSVGDTGIGLKPEIREKIFERHFTTKGEHGSGIGLATVKKIIDAHNGLITLESEEGKGAIFTVALPLGNT